MRDALMKKPVSHYESLNVTRDAPTEVIRAAYKSLSQKHHPDKNVGNQAAADTMSRLNAAYTVLSDPEQRKQYDLQMVEEQLAAGGAVSVLFQLRRAAFSRRGRIAAALVGTVSVGLMLVVWSARVDEEKSRMLAQAAVYQSGTEAPPASDWPALSYGKNDSSERGGKSKGASVAVIETAGPSGLGGSGAEPASAAPPAKAAAVASTSAGVKQSEFERLTAMLKGMGLGLHKLELPSIASSKPAAPAPVPAPAQATAKSPAPARTGDAVAAAPAAASAPRSAAATEASRAREEERPVAQEAARSESRAVADAGRASAPAAAIVASAGNAARNTVITDPRDCPTPTYPERSYRNGETGTVLLSLLVGNDGRVIESKVQKSSGFPELDKATKKAVAQCKFKPADGQVEPVWTKMVYAWSLDQ
jgi:TonB family protein